MEIVDLTGRYLEMRQGGQKAVYEGVAPWFFEHYFSYWADQNVPYEIIAQEELLIRKTRVLHFLSRAETTAREMGISTSNVTAVLFIGKGVSNGHAFLDADGNPVVWYALESYPTDDAARTFVAHEFAHALQYFSDPAFSFDTTERKNELGRQILTEGFATFFAQRIESLSDEKALWADFLDRRGASEWTRSCERRLKEMCLMCVNGWQGNAMQLFFANDASDVLRFRAGYYVGLKVMQDVSRAVGADWPSVLKMHRTLLERHVLHVLQKYLQE